jgi:energy-converting hydrogenase Eha subunit C
VDICLATRPLNGGLINLQELCQFLRQRRKTDRGVVFEDDCLRAISKLKVLCFTVPLNQILNITFFGRGSNKLCMIILTCMYFGIACVCLHTERFVTCILVDPVVMHTDVSQIFQVLGSGFEVISVGKKKLVRSVPTELNKDHNEILELAQVALISLCLDILI